MCSASEAVGVLEVCSEEAAPPKMPKSDCNASKNRLSRSSGINMKSCNDKPGKASSCSRDHFTPLGMKRLAGSSAISACSLVPMRHSRLSVFNREPLQVGQVV